MCLSLRLCNSVRVSTATSRPLPSHALSRFSDGVLDADTSGIRTWLQFASIATHKAEFGLLLRIVDDMCGDAHEHLDVDMFLECLAFMSHVTLDVHSYSYDVQSPEVVFDHRSSAIGWRSQRAILDANAADVDRFACAHERVYWPTAMSALRSLIRYSSANHTAEPRFRNVDCFFAEFS